MRKPENTVTIEGYRNRYVNQVLAIYIEVYKISCHVWSYVPENASTFEKYNAQG
jgi:hypothetical protein